MQSYFDEVHVMVITMLLLPLVAFCLSIKVGIYDDYPMCYMENNTPKGFYVDILKYIASKEKWDLVFVYDKWGKLLDMLEKGEIDALAAIAYTAEREKIYDFNNEPFISNWGIVVAKKQLISIFELSGMTVALVKKDVYAERFLKMLEEFHVDVKAVWVDNYEEVMEYIDEGKAYAGVVSRFFSTLESHKRSCVETPIIFASVDLKMAFKKGSAINLKIIPVIDRYLKEMKSQKRSVYWKSLSRYFEASFKMPEWLKLFILISIGSLAFLLIILIILKRLVNIRTRELLQRTKELQGANQQINAMNEQMRSLYNELQETFDRFQDIMVLTSQVGTFEASEKEFLENVLDMALKLVPKAKYGSVSLIKGDRWVFITTKGHDIEKLRDLPLRREYAVVNIDSAKIVDRIMDKNKVLMPPELFEEFSKAAKPVKSSILSPLKFGGKLIGFFSLDIPEGSEETFTEQDVEIVDKFSRIISGFYVARRYMEVEGKFHKNVAIALVKALESYDPYMKGHSERVAQYSTNLAERLHFEKSMIRKIYWAGLVHDIGKIIVPRSILNKAGKLTEEEYEIVKKHALKGYEILLEVEGMDEIAKIVKHHHERWDGRGYPDGLKEEQIPIESRIIALSDAFDAMTSARPYRDPLSVEEALNEIMENKGTQFDPNLADVFVQMIMTRSA